MAYFIFLKSLRILEEFRKNPHVKIPPKSSCANFQSLAIFKKLIFIQKGIFLRISAHPAPPRPTLSRFAPKDAGSPLGPSHVGVFSERRILFDLAHSGRDASLSHITAMWGLPVSSIPFLTPADRCHFSSSSLATPRRQLHPRMPPEQLLAPPSSPTPLIPS
jgi:hypothetical protein